MSTDYGVFNKDTGVSKRAIVIIDKEGIVQFSETYKSAMDLNPNDILAKVKKL